MQTRDGAVALQAIYGVVKTQHAFFGVAVWVHINDDAAKVRTRDRRHSVLVESEQVAREPLAGRRLVRAAGRPTGRASVRPAQAANKEGV